MTPDQAILSGLQGEIRAFLGDPALDVAAAEIAGDISLSAEPPPPGLHPILRLTDGRVVAITQHFKYRYLSEREELALVEKLRREGVTTFAQLLAALREDVGRRALSDAKVRGMGLTRALGHDMILRPHMGQLIPMRRDVSPQFHHMVVQQILRTELAKGFDAVLDAGSGRGDILAELAASLPDQRVKFFGGDISRSGQACLRHFAETAGLQNVSGVEFNLYAPDFSFLAGVKRLFFYSHFALAYHHRFSPEFWRMLFRAAPDVEVALLEPLSYRLPHLTNAPLFTEERATAYNISTSYFDAVLELEAAGELEIVETVPDITGLTSFNAVSLLRFKKTQR